MASYVLSADWIATVGGVLSGLTNVPLFLVQLHAPSVPFRDFPYIFVRLASPASSSEASAMALSLHLL